MAHIENRSPWQIDDKDVVRVNALIAGQAGSALIRARQERNLGEPDRCT